MLAKLNTVNIGCRVEIYAPGSAFHEAHGIVTSWCNLDQNIASPCMAYVRIQRGIYRGGIYPIHQKNLKLMNGKNVSGLHTVSNLQYLPAGENLTSSNRRK